MKRILTVWKELLPNLFRRNAHNGILRTVYIPPTFTDLLYQTASSSTMKNVEDSIDSPWLKYFNMSGDGIKLIKDILLLGDKKGYWKENGCKNNTFSYWITFLLRVVPVSNWCPPLDLLLFKLHPKLIIYNLNVWAGFVRTDNKIIRTNFGKGKVCSHIFVFYWCRNDRLEKVNVAPDDDLLTFRRRSSLPVVDPAYLPKTNIKCSTGLMLPLPDGMASGKWFFCSITYLRVAAEENWRRETPTLPMPTPLP